VVVTLCAPSPGDGRAPRRALASHPEACRPHPGAKRATVAAGHSIHVAAWHMLHDLVPYQDLGPDHFTNRLGKERQTRRLLAQLTALGRNVTVTPRDEAR
jgi:transposase